MNTPEDHALRYREEPEERRWERELERERADVALVPLVDTRRLVEVEPGLWGFEEAA